MRSYCPAPVERQGQQAGFDLRAALALRQTLERAVGRRVGCRLFVDRLGTPRRLPPQGANGLADGGPVYIRGADLQRLLTLQSFPERQEDFLGNVFALAGHSGAADPGHDGRDDAAVLADKGFEAGLGERDRRELRVHGTPQSNGWVPGRG